MTLVRRIRYYSDFLVIRWQLVLLIGFVMASWYVIRTDSYTKGFTSRFDEGITPYEFLLRHWGVVLLAFGLLLVALSIMTALFTWIWFLIHARRVMEEMDMQFGKGKLAVAGNVAATVTVPVLIRPLLGLIRVRMKFSDDTVTADIPLTDNVREKNKFWRRAISGSRFLALRDRREYHITEVQFFFQDMFRLVAFPGFIPTERSMYVVPPEKPLLDLKADPNKTEEQEIRIPTPKRVEGEIINYKDFEPGDDVRRIVWKIYARTRQLVVRIPETTDPYASHIYLYASFYHGFPEGRKEKFDSELLNLYKDHVRNLYESLLVTGLDVRFIPDQETSTNFSVEEKDVPVYHISTAHWQTNRDLRSYVVKKDAGLVAVSSLIPVADVEQLLQDLPANVTLVLVKVSDVFRHHRIFKFKDLFFQHTNESLDRVKRSWLLSGFRRRLLKNEKAIEQLLKKSNVNAMHV